MATIAAPASSDSYIVTPAPYPARTQTASLVINGIQTVATAVDFTDKIVVTITQQGRLAHWVCTHT